MAARKLQTRIYIYESGGVPCNGIPRIRLFPTFRIGISVTPYGSTTIVRLRFGARDSFSSSTRRCFPPSGTYALVCPGSRGGSLFYIQIDRSVLTLGRERFPTPFPVTNQPVRTRWSPQTRPGLFFRRYTTCRIHNFVSTTNVYGESIKFSSLVSRLRTPSPCPP